jgi:hypothetical protein
MAAVINIWDAKRVKLTASFSPIQPTALFGPREESRTTYGHGPPRWAHSFELFKLKSPGPFPNTDNRFRRAANFILTLPFTADPPSFAALAHVCQIPTASRHTPEDLADALAFALRFDGRKRKSDAAEMMARIVAERLVRQLETSGFVVMKSRRLLAAWR